MKPFLTLSVGTWQQPRIVILDLYNELKNLSKEKDWKIGSVQALYRIIQAVPAPMQTFSIGGRRAVEYQYMPKIKRDLSVYHVMEMIVGDQHLFDYCVLGDDGEVFTPEMYAWIDQRSRYWVGVFPSFGHYSSADIGLSLKAACRWGIPKNLSIQTMVSLNYPVMSITSWHSYLDYPSVITMKVLIPMAAFVTLKPSHGHPAQR